MTPRQQALVNGEKYYTTGKPCKQGHIAKRATLTGTCYQCTLNAAQDWAGRNRDKYAAYARKYRDQNRERVRERGRIRQAQRRAANPEHIRRINQRSAQRKAAAEGRTIRPFGRLTRAELQAQLQAAHGARIEYVSGYRSKNTNAMFRCVEHNTLCAAHPHNVLRGANPCPQCNHMKSAAEDAIFRFISTFAPAVQRDRATLKPRELDILLPEHNLAVEYCGMYWHSHGSLEEERRDKRKHAAKYQDCKALGIRLLTIYESEWATREPQIRRLLRNMLGKSRGRLMARKCELRAVTAPDAREFFDMYHVQGGAGYGEHYGLYHRDKLVACMRFTLGGNDRGAAAAQRTWTLSRFATRLPVVGAASRLFTAFVREHQPTAVKSFSDNRYFDGGMYEKLGFTLEAEVAPDYQVWSPKAGLRPKSHYQRRLLPARLAEHGVATTYDPQTDPRTESEMTFLMGARRIYDCGKKRWVWYPTPESAPS